MSKQIARIIPLPEELSLRTVETVHEEMTGAAVSREDVVIDCSGLKQVDFAGLQLLVSAFRTSDAVGASLRLSAVPPILEAAVARAGIGLSAAGDRILINEA